MNQDLQVYQLELFKTSRPISISFGKPKFSFVDLFSGIGGFRIPLEDLGGQCLAYSEIDKNALEVYRQNFITYVNSDEIYLGNIINLDQLAFNVDLMVGGVPCQPWSIAGKSQGFKDNRGQLWFEVIRLIKLNRPKAFIFENVKGLTEPRNQDNLDFIIKNLTNIGYYVKYSVLNSYDFGLPQDRDRVFIVGIRQDIDNYNNFCFPKALNLNPKLYEVIEDLDVFPIQKKKFAPKILFGDRIPASRGRFQKIDELNDFFTFTDIRDGHTTIHSWDLIKTSTREKLICKTILKNRRKKIYGKKDGNPLSYLHLKDIISDLNLRELNTLCDKNILRLVEGKGYEFVNSKISSGIKGVAKIFLPHSDVISTLTATGTRDFIATQSLQCQEPNQYKQTFIKKIYRKNKYKSLSARDCARLQGFPDSFIYAKNENIAKKQFGNAVSVPVVYHLAKAVVEIII